MRIGFVLFATSLIFTGGCGEPEEQIPVHALSGVITSTSVDANGALAHIKLVSSGGEREDPGLSTSDCMIVGPRCEFGLNAYEGEYNVFGFVDLDGNASVSEPLPSSGDLIAGSRPLILWSDEEMDFPDEAWIQIH